MYLTVSVAMPSDKVQITPVSRALFAESPFKGMFLILNLCSNHDAVLFYLLYKSLFLDCGSQLFASSFPAAVLGCFWGWEGVIGTLPTATQLQGASARPRAGSL